MPIIKAEQLRDLAEKLLIAVGASRKDATTIASHSIGANLVGHDSHGIIQIPTYIDRVKRGHIIPDASYEIVKDSPTTTVVDGHWGFGYVVTEMAMRTTIEKARSQNIAAATVFRQSHIGRLADYPLMASEANMIGLITADSTDFAMYLKSSRPAKGFKEVYYPGELEHLRRVHHEANGIDVDQSTWDQLTQLAREYGINDALLKMEN